MIILGQLFWTTSDGGFVPPPPVVTAKTGAGGIDPGEGQRRIYKPSGLLERPRKKKGAVPAVEARVQETHEIARELAREAKHEAFDVEAYLPVEQMTMEQVDGEIARLLHKRIKTEEENVALLILLAMAL